MGLSDGFKTAAENQVEGGRRGTQTATFCQMAVLHATLISWRPDVEYAPLPRHMHPLPGEPYKLAQKVFLLVPSFKVHGEVFISMRKIS